MKLFTNCWKFENGEGRFALAATALEVSPSLRPKGTSQKGPNACHMQNIEIGSISKKKLDLADSPPI